MNFTIISHIYRYRMSIKTLKHALSPFVKEARILSNDIQLLLKGKKKLSSRGPVVTFSNKGADTFFGYYDISPFRKKEVIYVIKPKEEDYLDVAINDLDGSSQHIIARTQAWNWQQGCRLRWFPSDGRIISFNDWDGNGHYFNTILNLDLNNNKIIDYPLYDIDSKGEKGLSIDFERLGRMRPGYGYTRNGHDLTPQENHGIDIIDIHNNTLITTIPYDRIIGRFRRSITIENCYLNHLSFSPDGTKFLFFLIEIINGYHMAYLLVYDILQDKLLVLDEDEKVSHYVWKNNEAIICTAYSDTSTCRYYSYDITKQTKVLLAPNSLDRDGHPSISNKEGVILTDTYPDSHFFQHLMYVDIEHDMKFPIADVYSDPHTTGEMRTDLHPRFNETQDCVSFDANIHGNRNLYVVRK